MRTKLALLALTAVIGALVAASVAVGAKPTPTAFKLKAALNVGQEKPVPKGTKLRCLRPLHGNTERYVADVAADVHAPLRARHRGAHPPSARARSQARSSCRSAARARRR